MPNPNKIKGDRYQRDLRDWLATVGFPWTQVTRAGYERDYGDLHPLPGRVVVIQAKNVKTWRLSEWLVELAEQVANAGAELGALFVKRPRSSDPGRSYVVMEAEHYVRLLRAAGYGDALEDREAS